MNPKGVAKYLRGLIGAGLLLSACAKLGSPGGGPEDKTAPDIIAVRPTAGSINVPLDTDFEIIFSKNMNETTTEQAVFISPLFFNYPTYKWSGKKLRIKPAENLKPNATYVLTVGASATDNHGNKLGQSMSFPFSTGETIYNGSAFGQVLQEGLPNLNIWAYALTSADPDTFWKRLPDYVTQPDSSGRFRFDFLSFGLFLVVAVEDKNNDQFWEPPGEKLALPDSFIDLSDSSITAGPLLLRPVARDTLAPQLSKVVSPDKFTIAIGFSQGMDSSTVLAIENYDVHEVSDTGAVVRIESIQPATKAWDNALIRCSDMIDGEKYKLSCSGLTSKYGVIGDSLSKIFQAGGEDTTRPAITAIDPPPGRKPQRTNFIITLIFSELMDTLSFNENCSIADTGGAAVDYKRRWLYRNLLKLIPSFMPGRRYDISLDSPNIFDLAGNSLGDSLQEFYYILASADSLGEITGKIANAPGDPVIIMAGAIGQDTVMAEADEDRHFTVTALFPAVYHLSAFYDVNNNGRFDGGGIRPFRFAEPIALYADTVSVRARWETDIGIINFAPAAK